MLVHTPSFDFFTDFNPPVVNIIKLKKKKKMRIFLFVAVALIPLVAGKLIIVLFDFMDTLILD